MEESSPRVSRKEGKGGGGPTTRKNSRYAIDEGSGDLIECSGKYCRSCTAGIIADCVALCCCPCALLNLLTFTLVKLPWKMGRRCLGRGKKKSIRKRKCKKSCSDCCRSSNAGDDHDHDHNQYGDHGKLRESVRVEQEICEFPTGFGEEEEPEQEMGDFSARFEAEKVWLELYQVGHLGFGRVSFTGV